MAKYFQLCKHYIRTIISLSPSVVRHQLMLAVFFSLTAASGMAFSPMLLRFTTDSFSHFTLLFSWLTGYVLLLCFSRLLTVIGGFLCRVALEEFSVSVGRKVLMTVFSVSRWHLSINTTEWTHLLQISKSNNAAIISTSVNVIFPLLVKVFLSLTSLVYFQDYFTTLLLIAYLIICSLLNISRVKAISRKYTKAMNASARVSGVLGDILNNAGLVRGLNGSSVAISRYDQAGQMQRERYREALSDNNSIDVSNTLIFMSVLGISLAHAAWQVNIGTQTLGYFIMVNAIVYQVCQPLEGLLRAIASVSDCATMLKDTVKKLNMKSLFLDIPDISDPESVPFSDRGSIEFRGVKFRYPGTSSAWLFSGLTFALESPGLMAVTGPSGSGKSTFLKMLCGDLEPSEGDVLINSTRINNLTQSDIYTHLCIISQDPGLFNDTVRFNLLIASPHADDDMLTEALYDCHLADWFSQLPLGFDTLLGPGGVPMSGGERQRFALTRALLRDTPVIAIDEGTSALDYANESLYLNTLVALARRKVIIIVTHRLSSISAADAILVLDKNGEFQFGPVKTLLESNQYIQNFLNIGHDCAGTAET